MVNIGKIELLSKDISYTKLPIVGTTKGYLNNLEYHGMFRGSIYNLSVFMNSDVKVSDKCRRDYNVAYNFYLQHMDKLINETSDYENGLQLFNKDLEIKKQIFNDYKKEIYEYFINNGMPFFVTSKQEMITATKLFTLTYSENRKIDRSATYNNILINYLLISEFEDKNIASYQKFIKK